MGSFEKTLIREQPDEILVYKKRIAGKLQTIHHIQIYNQPFSNGKCWIVYNRKKAGSGSRTKILNRLRKLIT